MFLAQRRWIQEDRKFLCVLQAMFYLKSQPSKKLVVYDTLMAYFQTSESKDLIFHQNYLNHKPKLPKDEDLIDMMEGAKEKSTKMKWLSNERLTS